MSSVGEYILQELNRRYPVRNISTGEDEHLDKGPMHFHVRSYDVEGLGHYCLLDMKAFFGLMKMETAVLAVTKKDVPLFNSDVIFTGGKRTQMAEFYDTLLGNVDHEFRLRCLTLKDADADLPDYVSGEHWYDDLYLPFSYAKKTKAKELRSENTCKRYADAFLESLERAADCDEEAKKKKVRAFAQGLLDHGGPAVDPVKKMFGEETTKRLILRHMYGVE